MNTKKKPVVKPVSTKQKKSIAKVARPKPGIPLDGTQRKLAEGALQDAREDMEKVIGKARINKEKQAAELATANKELAFQKEEKEKRAAELAIANKELAFNINERKQAEEALLVSEARYRPLLDAMLEGCQIIGFDWRYLYVNDAVTQHGHQPKEILLGHTMMEVYPGIENTELFAALRRCMNGRTPQQMENEFAYPDGMKGWFELSIQPVPEGIFILSIDITRRKRAEETIHTLARFPSENPNPVLRIARDGILLYCNPAALTLLKKWKLRVGKPAPEVLKNLTNEALETETTKTVDIPCGDCIFSIAIAPAPEGEYINLYARDVTARVQADQQLKEREALLNEVGVIAKIGGWEMDITTGKATWSKGTYDIVEIDYNKPVPGLHEHVGYYLPEYREMIESRMNALIETKQPMKFEAVLKTAKGNMKWCQALGEAVVKDGKLIKLRGTFQDITERKRAEEALASSEQFLSNVIEQSPVSLWISDSEGTLIKMNQACRELFGITDEEAVGKYNLLKDNLIEAQGFMALVGDVFEKGEIARFTIDYDIPRVEHIEVKEGTHRILDVVISPIKDIHGILTNVLVQHKDITELKQAEEQIKRLNTDLEAMIEKRTAQLKETLELNQKMIEVSSIGIFACRADGPCIIANPAIARISGAPVETMLQLNFRKMESWKKNGLFDKAEAALATGEEQRAETHLITTFGKDVWLNYYFTTFTSNNRLHFLMLVEDITERKKAEEELMKYHEHLEEMVKTRTEELRKAMDDLARSNTELEQRVADRTAQLQTANKQLESELAERARVEDAIRESENRFQSLSEASLEAIVIHDDGILLSANSQYSKMFGYAPEELPGKQVIPLTVAPEAIEAMRKEIATGGEGPYESTGLRKGGTRFPMEIRVREVEYKGRKARVAAIMDITERKKAEEELMKYHEHLEEMVKTRTDDLRKAMDDLARSNTELERFAYVASHDLQEPLRMVTSYLQLLERRYKDQLDGEALEFINYAVDGSTRMKTLINDLLAYSRVGTRGKEFTLTDCEDILERVLSTLQVSIKESQARVTHDPLPKLIADDTQLEMLFQNLIGNAIKFHGEKPPRVHVGVKKDEKNWIFSVSDNGIGIDPQFFERIFIIFQRLHNREDYPGTGIGLAISKRIVERHGGRIWIESQPEKGSTFFFTLPIIGESK